MKLDKLLKWIFIAGFGGIILYSLSEDKIKELRYGKEYTYAKRTLDSTLHSELDLAKYEYFVKADGVEIGSPKFQDIKREYQKKEQILIENWYNNTKKLENSAKR
ncbi:MAG: hypothetical protein ACP5NZ_05005 [Nanobdellota archaeon]